ncbi:hypothetical protein GCM10010264_21810 [Streptomyces globisporus]|nr:hypothetical protein GCM10010264_21810 [Streptomyces globisporus]
MFACRSGEAGSGGPQRTVTQKPDSGLRAQAAHAAEPAAGSVLRCANDLPASSLCPVGKASAGREAGLTTALTESPQTFFYYYPASSPPCGPTLQHAAATDEENQ